jgi:hypothetical protein
MIGTLFCSFLLHALAGAVGSGLLMLSLARGTYEGIFIMFATPVIGLACGVIGIGSGYFAHKKHYFTALAITTVLAISVVIMLHRVFR